MRNYNSILLLIFFTCIFLVSCEDESLNLESESTLLIETIPVESGMYSFKDEAQFREVIKDYYKNQKKYKKYFKETKFPSYLVQKENLKRVDKTNKTHDELVNLIKEYKLVINNQNEVSMPFKFSYQNAFYNLEGKVKIKDVISQITPIDFNSLNERSQSASCNTSYDYKKGTWCASRRLKGEIVSQFKSTSPSQEAQFGECFADYDIESRTTYFVRQAGIWFHNDASTLETSSTHQFFINRKIPSGSNNVQTILYDFINGEDEVITGTTLHVSQSSSGGCVTANSTNHGIVSSNSTHFGNDSDGCGIKNKTISISVCN